MADELEVPHIPAGDHQLGRWVAIFTAIVATMGGIVGHEASQIANEAILYKNEAGLKKTDAANQWAYYQAVSTKSHLMELAKELTPAQSHSGYEEKLANMLSRRMRFSRGPTRLRSRSRRRTQRVRPYASHGKACFFRSPCFRSGLASLR